MKLLFLLALLLPSVSGQLNDTVSSSQATLLTSSVLPTQSTPTSTPTLPPSTQPTPTTVARVSTAVSNGTTKIITVFTEATTTPDQSFTAQPAFFSSQTNVIAVSVSAVVLAGLIVFFIICIRRSRKAKDMVYRPSEHQTEFKRASPPLVANSTDRLQPQQYYQDIYANPSAQPFFQQQYHQYQQQQPVYYDHNDQQFYHGDDGQVYHGEQVYHEEQFKEEFSDPRVQPLRTYSRE